MSDSYICFFDLLGTKNLIKTNPKKYTETIELFGKVIRLCIDKYADDIIACRVFSDCIYVESANLYKLCVFLRLVREELLQKGVCFNAAIRSGSLSIEEIIINNGIGNILMLKNDDTVNVFSQQVNFTGAGICLDNDLQGDPSIKQMIVRSIYASVVDEKIFRYHSFCDIGFGLKDVIFLKFVMRMFIETYVNDIRASRYYITMICTYLREAWSDVNDDTRFEILSILSDGLYVLRDDDYKTAIILMIFDIVCGNDTSYEIDEIVDDNIKYFDGIFDANGLCFSNIGRFGASIISEYNKRVVSRYVSYKNSHRRTKDFRRSVDK